MKNLLLAVPVIFVIAVIVLAIRASCFDQYVESESIQLLLLLCLGVSVASFMFWLASVVEIKATSTTVKTYRDSDV
ncbi:hypothetical protein [Endozoicomonas ascidiicola]|uniref:hypothetical protein n=1 Tax=Endozoicomonas ascidiicola TaxID=1698521 RepID=UPI0008317B27|nr:hypothetical protein [Endozoicomonas ascidiicola]